MANERRLNTESQRPEQPACSDRRRGHGDAERGGQEAPQSSLHLPQLQRVRWKVSTRTSRISIGVFSDVKSFLFSYFCLFSSPAVFVFSLTLQFPVISQRLWHGEEEAAYLPHRRLREGLRENVSSPSSPALAQRREAIRLQLDVLREEVHQERRAAETQEDTHR